MSVLCSCLIDIVYEPLLHGSRHVPDSQSNSGVYIFLQSGKACMSSTPFHLTLTTLPSLTNEPVENTEGIPLLKIHPLYTPLCLRFIGVEHLMYICVKVLSCGWLTKNTIKINRTKLLCGNILFPFLVYYLLLSSVIILHYLSDKELEERKSILITGDIHT